jgi:hypothetical protein
LAGERVIFQAQIRNLPASHTSARLLERFEPDPSVLLRALRAVMRSREAQFCLLESSYGERRSVFIELTLLRRSQCGAFPLRADVSERILRAKLPADRWQPVLLALLRWFSASAAKVTQA